MASQCLYQISVISDVWENDIWRAGIADPIPDQKGAPSSGDMRFLCLERMQLYRGNV